MYSALELVDGYYQLLMRESDIPLKAVSTPSGMLWEWLVIPQGLSNAPATFNRCVTNLLRSVRDFAPSYFEDVFVQSRAMNETTDFDIHRTHVRKVLTLMRSISCTLISRIVSSLQARYHLLVASWVSTAYALIQKRPR